MICEQLDIPSPIDLDDAMIIRCFKALLRLRARIRRADRHPHDVLAWIAIVEGRAEALPLCRE